MSDDELKKYSGSNLPATELSHNATPYPASRMAPAIELVDMAREIAQANNQVTQHTSSKLKLIAKQIKALQDEAHRILQTAQQDQMLHEAECNFKKQVGRIYHLYQKNNGKRYFSMLSVEEWGGRAPHAYIGSYRLEADMSWTPLEDIDTPDETASLVQQLLENKNIF